MNGMTWAMFGGAAVLAASTGCIRMDDTADTTVARLRVVHASPDAPAVDVCANGQAAFRGATFPAATEYAVVPAGTYAIRVTGASAGCGSAAVIAADLPLAAGQDVSVVALNVLSEIEPLVLVDDNTAPAAGNAKVRFVHAGADAPTVDITLNDGTTLFDNVSFKQATSYLQVPAGTYSLQVRDQTGAVVVLAVGNVTLEEGTVSTVFAIGLLNGAPALNAFVSRDN